MSERRFPIGVHATLADLHEWHIIDARCTRCGHQAELAPAWLRARRPKTTLLSEIEKKLACSECGGKLNRMTIRSAPR